MIRISNCDEAKPLLVILGYRLRENCGPAAALETFDSNRAFLTIDSGFPLADLEDTLRGGKTFEIPYSSTKVPVLFEANDWIVNKKNANKGVLDSLLAIRLARLYRAMSRIDNETGAYLWKSSGRRSYLFPPRPWISMAATSACAPDEFLCREERRRNRPGRTWWRQSKSPADFVTRLLEKDDGWLAAYFDALSRVSRSQQTYFADPRRLQRFYEALRGQDISPSPTKHSFRPDEGLFLLVSRVQVDPDGQPHIPREPGRLERDITAENRFQNHSSGGQSC